MTRVADLALTCDCLSKPEPVMEPGDIYVPCFVCMAPETRREWIDWMEPRYGEAATARKLAALRLAWWALGVLVVVAVISAVAQIAR